MRYRINWTENVGYYTYIEAESPQEALRLFHEGPIDSCEEDGFCEMQDDAEATEDPKTEGE